MKVVIVCGATATGKSDLAVQLAEKLNCEILNFDSIQVYKELDVGSAKPTLENLKKIKHHLISAIDPNQVFTAGDFERAAMKILNQLSVKHKFVVLVGGTGFYLQALLKGMFEVVPIDPALKQKLLHELEAKGAKELHGELKEKDPAAAAKIHVNDSYRILRALEILRSQSVKPSELKAQKIFPFEYVKIGLRREKAVLRNAVAARSDQMIKQGLVKEVEILTEKYGSSLRALQSVGYREALDFVLNKSQNTKELSESITTSTMQLVKKQSTWFKRDEEIHWFDPDKENVLEKALGLLIIQRWL